MKESCFCGRTGEVQDRLFGEARMRVFEKAEESSIPNATYQTSSI